MIICNYGCGQEAKYQFKNKKWCCKSSANKCPNVRKNNSKANKGKHVINDNLKNIRNKIVYCKYCGILITYPNKKKHENACFLNPDNVRFCFCGNVIKNKSTTCSHLCANNFFKNQKKRKDEDCSSRTICFRYHKKECIVCQENLIVETHHYDKNTKNNHPSNFIPLCPTHHKYMHSNHKFIIKKCVDEYHENYLRN